MNLSFAFIDWNVIQNFILKGFIFSIQLTFVAMVGGIALGTIIALMRLSGKKWLVYPAAFYVNTLRSMTQGRAAYTMTFDHYAPVPQAVADEVITKLAG